MTSHSRALGWIDEFISDRSGTRVRGWILCPFWPLERITLKIDGVVSGGATLTDYQGVADAYPAIPHALTSAFAVEAAGLPEAPRHRLEILGHAADHPDVVLAWSIHDAPSVRPPPPPQLRQRVAGTEDLSVFRQQGFQMADDLMDALVPFRAAETVVDVLDWGCGCGRLTAALLDLHPRMRIVGCDIDGETIGWAAEHLRPASFVQTGLFPPSQYH